MADEPQLWKGALAGLAAGLVASLVMDGFQRALSALSPSDNEGEPATEKAADRVALETTGLPVPQADKPLAGQAVHYALGAALGVGYGVTAEALPVATAGGGTAFGLAAAIVLDEVAVPAMGLGDAPWQTPASTHAYTIASHLVFGAAAEATRRLVRRALD